MNEMTACSKEEEIIHRTGKEFHSDINDHVGHLSMQLAPLAHPPLHSVNAIAVGRGPPWTTHSWRNSLSLPREIECLGLTNIRWCYLDVFGGCFPSTTSEQPMLNDLCIWCDFNHVPSLQYFPSQCIDLIIMEWSTWRYMRPCDGNVLSEWKRILKPGGRLIFDADIASIRLIESSPRMHSFQSIVLSNDSWCYEQDNLCHPVLLNETALNAFMNRIILPATTDNRKSMLLAYYAIADAQRQRLAQYYHALFVQTNGFQSCNAHTGPYPIPTTRSIMNWIIVQK